MTDAVKKLKELVDSSNNIVFFGGAGVSTESGIPDFRSTGGLVEPVDILGHHGLQFSGGLPFRQLVVGGVGLGLRGQHLGPIEAEEFFGVAFVEGMA